MSISLIITKKVSKKCYKIMTEDLGKAYPMSRL